MSTCVHQMVDAGGPPTLLLLLLLLRLLRLLLLLPQLQLGWMWLMSPVWVTTAAAAIMRVLVSMLVAVVVMVAAAALGVRCTGRWQRHSIAAIAVAAGMRVSVLVVRSTRGICTGRAHT